MIVYMRIQISIVSSGVLFWELLLSSCRSFLFLDLLLLV